MTTDPDRSIFSRWVNARIELVIPLDVDPDANEYDKQDAAADVTEAISSALPADLRRRIVMRTTHEVAVAYDPGPEPVIPEPPAPQTPWIGGY